VRIFVSTRYTVYVTCLTSPIFYYLVTMITNCTGVLISPYPDQEGNKLMFLSEWREFPSAPYLAKKKKLDDSSRLDVVEIACVPDMPLSLFPSWSG